MREAQQWVKDFNEAREWNHVHTIKDLLLNMNEEIGEMWHIIKWVDADKQAELIAKHRDEVENFVGDMQYLILKIAAICGVDSKKAITDVMDEYEKRFPLDKTKGHHANTRAGGVDLKQ
jgi:dCTP diphosphatase